MRVSIKTNIIITFIMIHKLNINGLFLYFNFAFVQDNIQRIWQQAVQLL